VFATVAPPFLYRCKISIAHPGQIVNTKINIYIYSFSEGAPAAIRRRDHASSCARSAPQEAPNTASHPVPPASVQRQELSPRHRLPAAASPPQPPCARPCRHIISSIPQRNIIPYIYIIIIYISLLLSVTLYLFHIIHTPQRDILPQREAFIYTDNNPSIYGRKTKNENGFQFQISGGFGFQCVNNIQSMGA
jgi:hypothetical protein